MMQWRAYAHSANWIIRKAHSRPRTCQNCSWGKYVRAWAPCPRTLLRWNMSTHWHTHTHTHTQTHTHFTSVWHGSHYANGTLACCASCIEVRASVSPHTALGPSSSDMHTRPHVLSDIGPCGEKLLDRPWSAEERVSGGEVRETGAKTSRQI